MTWGHVLERPTSRVTTSVAFSSLLAAPPPLPFPSIAPLLFPPFSDQAPTEGLFLPFSHLPSVIRELSGRSPATDAFLSLERGGSCKSCMLLLVEGRGAWREVGVSGGGGEVRICAYSKCCCCSAELCLNPLTDT